MAVDDVHIIAPNVAWIITCIHSLRHLQNYLGQTKQLITAVKTFVNQSLTSHHAAA